MSEQLPDADRIKDEQDQWRNVSNVVKLEILECESSVLLDSLFADDVLIGLLRSGASKEVCLGHINEVIKTCSRS